MKLGGNSTRPIVQAWSFCLIVLVVVADANAEETNNALSRPAIAMSNVWFVRAGANGDGTSIDTPIGSTEQLEAVAEESDVIIVLASKTTLQGGLALKKGQRLIGLPTSDKKPVITNRESQRHNGHGIVLANDTRIANIRIESTYASGITGSNVSGVRIDNVEVVHANTSRTSATSEIRALGPMSHGAIVLQFTGDGMSKNRVTRSVIRNSAGIGVGGLVTDGAKARLLIDDVQVIDGTPVGRIDWGIVAVADGPGSQSILELTDSVVMGRLNANGRNVVVIAGAHAISNARIERCQLGTVGQDGILGAVGPTPASVSLQISDTVIEKAGQANLEGTILNLPPFDLDKAADANLTIEIDNTVIRGAGTINGVRKHEACNILLTRSPFDQQESHAKGNYRLRVRNSRIADSAGYGLVVGGDSMWDDDNGLPPDESIFNVKLRKSTIMGNARTGILIDVANAKIDARQNGWGGPPGVEAKKYEVHAPAKPSQIDASAPVAVGP